MLPDFKLGKIFSIVLLISLFYVLDGKAQNNSIKEHRGPSFLTVNLLSWFNFSPRWRVGYIENFHPIWKVGVDIGYGNNNLTVYDMENHYQLWEIRPEIYYLINPGQKTLQYFSAELFYIDHKEIIFNSHYFPINGEPMDFDRIDYYRKNMDST